MDDRQQLLWEQRRVLYGRLCWTQDDEALEEKDEIASPRRKAASDEELREQRERWGGVHPETGLVVSMVYRSRSTAAKVARGGPYSLHTVTMQTWPYRDPDNPSQPNPHPAINK